MRAAPSTSAPGARPACWSWSICCESWAAWTASSPSSRLPEPARCSGSPSTAHAPPRSSAGGRRPSCARAWRRRWNRSDAELRLPSLRWRGAERGRRSVGWDLERIDLVARVGARLEDERVVLRLAADRPRRALVVAQRCLECPQSLPGLEVVGLQAGRLGEQRGGLAVVAAAVGDAGLGEQRLDAERIELV